MELGPIAGVILGLNLAGWSLVERGDFSERQIEPGSHIEESK